MQPMFKKITTTSLVLSFLLVAFFGSVAMSYGADGRMQGDCPFSFGVSLCPQNVLPGVIHHISAYQSFINVPLSLFVSSLLFVSVIILIFSFHLLLYKQFVPISYNSPPFTSQDRKIKRWLSLFENSPS